MIKLLMMAMQLPKTITFFFLFLQKLVLFEMQYRSFFDKFELEKIEVKSSVLLISQNVEIQSPNLARWDFDDRRSVIHFVHLLLRLRGDSRCLLYFDRSVRILHFLFPSFRLHQEFDLLRLWVPEQRSQDENWIVQKKDIHMERLFLS